jgi:SAM-dependent methyltransferase
MNEPTPPRDVGTHINTISYPEGGYSNKYQNWFYNKHKDDISGRILDIGAEENQEERYCNKNISYEYIPFDLRRDKSISVQGDASNLPFRSEVFDTVILREVIEHIPVSNVYDVFEEIHRVLSEGGKLLLSTPFRFQMHGLGYSDTLRLTADGLQTVLMKSGFSNMTIYKGGGFTESVLDPFLTAYHIILEKFGWGAFSVLFALVHYPIVLLATFISAIIKTILGENIFSKIFYLHNMAIATK